MAFKLPSRVKETTVTTGTGTYTLAGAVNQFQTFAAAGLANGDECFYYVEGGSDREVGVGTYSAGTLARTEIIESSNGDAAVSWGAGTKTIGIAMPGITDLSAANRARLASVLGIGPGRNLLHNGGFQIAQRGPGPFTSATGFVNNDDSYLLDGCIFLANGSDTCDVSRVADTDFVSGYKIRLDVETANRRFGVLFPIESANIRAIRKSGRASVQFKVKRTGSTLANVRAYLLSWSSTADTITSDVISAWGSAAGDPTFVANWTAENTGANLAVGTTVATHRIENIAVDTASLTNLALLIISDPTTTTVGDFLDIGDVQVEEGPVATVYEHRPPGVDLALSQRYFCKTFAAATAPAGAVGFPGAIAVAVQTVTGFYSYNWRYPVTMRGIPSLTFYNPGASGTAGYWRDGSDANSSQPLAFPVGDTGVNVFMNNGNSQAWTANAWYIHATASAEL